MGRILIIDDDAEFVQLLSNHLAVEGHQVRTVLESTEAVRAAFEFHPEVVLLDLTMPEMDGFEVCRRLRDFFDGVIMIVSANDQERSKVQGLDIGANDYVTKPFGHDEFMARIRAHLRDANRTPHRLPDFEDERISISLQKHTVLRDGERVALSGIEFDLLACLVRHAGDVVPHDRLLLEALGPDYRGEHEYLKAYIHRLRARLEPDPTHPRYVITHRSVGYSFGPGTAT